ncbi:site-specific integrase [Dysgonomonas sp. 520]|uniref:site-specific integrase n=1 Tax=Dysgonomonas sp. 520 TaxID=2302931 RepID=UPI0013D4518C|nr:site-specific integrase [Dysgonomonas sp. 520]NDW10045.1 site-specific integrase [Dysgonomonas sp. 520]
MASISFVFRPSTRIGDQKGSLSVRIIHMRRTKVLSLPFRIYPHEWDKDKQALVFPMTDQVRIHYLMQIEEKLSEINSIFEHIIENLELDGRYTAVDVVNYYKFRTDSGKLLNFVERQAMLLIKSGQERTARAYRTAAQALVHFNKSLDIPLNHINANLIKDFENEMKRNSKTPNTISFYMRNLRAIYNKAVSEKRILPKHANPFMHVYTGVQKTQKRALNIDEISRMNALDLSDKIDRRFRTTTNRDYLEGLDFAKRLFFFCFHARGMSFVDMAFLQKKNIRGNIIRYYRKKTGGIIEVKITPSMRIIMDSFKEEVRNTPYVFPIIIDPKKSPRIQYESALRLQNERLKKIAAFCGIKKRISTHVARHSWATIAKQENLPLWVISEGLGHSSEKTTYTYLASFDRSIIDRANEQITTAINTKK